MITIKDCVGLDIAKTFDCGQCFRFNKVSENVYDGVAFGKYVKFTQKATTLEIEGIGMDEWNSTWFDFFDMNTNYLEIQKIIATDEIIKNAIKYADGIRLLKQDLWECIISFIISQNNNIPRIKKIIETLCEKYGKAIIVNDSAGSIRYAFPMADDLANASLEELKNLGTGYRNEYILKTAQAVCDGSLDLTALSKMTTLEARNKLLSLKGIGGKVADCILLFGMHRLEVCPHDVWVKRIFSEKYQIENITEKKGYALASAKWGDYAGVAQQYLFYTERESR